MNSELIANNIETIVMAVMFVILLPYSLWLTKQKPKHYYIRIVCENCHRMMSVKIPYGNETIGHVMNQDCLACGYKTNKTIKNMDYIING
jgi:hypothetical protein